MKRITIHLDHYQLAKMRVSCCKLRAYLLGGGGGYRPSAIVVLQRRIVTIEACDH